MTPEGSDAHNEMQVTEQEIHDECGVFGVYAPGEDVARITYFGLFSLQHRGQESAGICVSDGTRLKLYKQMGLVQQVFSEDVLASLRGDLAIGHNRYSTTGSSKQSNAQPFQGRHRNTTFALGHNGNLVNAHTLRRELHDQKFEFDGSTDSEVICKLIESHEELEFESALTAAMGRLKGAFSLVVLTDDRLFGIRDAHGFRPLCLGMINGGHYALSSETCAFNVIGAKFIREVQPGEIVTIDGSGLREVRWHDAKPRLCLFEFVYLARPDSDLYGVGVHTARRRMGNLLWQEYPVDADLVMPVPLTGVPAAVGFAEASKIPFQEGLIYNRYIQRTFIEPDQRMREMGVQMKMTPIRDVLAGKRVVVVEDSVVRGTTTRNLVSLVREAGAREIHLRVCCPPYQYPCFYGIDTPNRNELIGAQMEVEQIRKFLGCDSLGYLGLDNLLKAVGIPNGKRRFCMACFDGHYPVHIPKRLRQTKLVLEDDSEV